MEIKFNNNSRFQNILYLLKILNNKVTLKLYIAHVLLKKKHIGGNQIKYILMNYVQNIVSEMDSITE